jgi:hypothetical protein
MSSTSSRRRSRRSLSPDQELPNIDMRRTNYPEGTILFTTDGEDIELQEDEDVDFDDYLINGRRHVRILYLLEPHNRHLLDEAQEHVSAFVHEIELLERNRGMINIDDTMRDVIMDARHPRNRRITVPPPPVIQPRLPPHKITAPPAGGARKKSRKRRKSKSKSRS